MSGLSLLLNGMLLFVPVAVVLEHANPSGHVWIFIASGLAIIPLAGWMGRSTEEIASYAGEGIGGLLNATFGNAAELIIAVVALNGGLYDVVKASLAGSIIGNVLLVLGVAMLAGGVRFNVQNYNALAARSQAAMLTLAAIALMGMAVFRSQVGTGNAKLDTDLSVAIACVLLAVYALNLCFELITHKQLFVGEGGERKTAPRWSLRRSLLVLAGATVLVAWMSEILVGAIEPTTHSLGLNSIFVGVFVVAILGNAAEHATAVLAAMKNRMDLSLSISIGSSVQIALFVAPLLVLLSHIVGPAPMDLIFRPGLVFSVFFAILITAQVAGNGESDWLKGAQLIAVYLILGLLFFFAPTLPLVPSGSG
ncbi:Ca2+:H+ antiporter [Syntrophus gentianae]|uniref:Ca(2+)/H(+) antiporter n=1 Tax=Syntrophus gentianae TaxID=43775 RepID=A0A1H7V7S2_9BACT|nr:calcium/proton exchanger [Syntrophus gentianae]SEM05322.1 Ca2+:H+ antiporter [Syntrophus gentianae]